MSEVVKFYPSDAAKDPDNVLEQSMGAYSEVLVLGWGKDGHLDARASLGMKDTDIIFIIEAFKHKLMCGDYYGDGE